MHPLTCAASKPSTHASHAAPTLPGRVHTRSLSTRDDLHPTLAPARPQICCPHVLGEGWRLPGSQETMFGSTSTCSSRAFQRYHPRVRQLPSWLSTFLEEIENQVPPPQARHPLPWSRHSRPLLHPLTCAACSPNTRASHPAPSQPGRYQFPALSTRVPISRPVALTWLVHTCQVLAGDSRRVRRPSSARSLRARRRRLNGAMYEFDCCRVPQRAAVCRGV